MDDSGIANKEGESRIIRKGRGGASELEWGERKKIAIAKHPTKLKRRKHKQKKPGKR